MPGFGKSHSEKMHSSASRGYVCAGGSYAAERRGRMSPRCHQRGDGDQDGTEEPEPREDGRGPCYPARIHPLLIYSVGRAAATDSQRVPPLGTALPNVS